MNHSDLHTTTFTAIDDRTLCRELDSYALVLNDRECQRKTKEKLEVKLRDIRARLKVLRHELLLDKTSIYVSELLEEKKEVEKDIKAVSLFCQSRSLYSNYPYAKDGQLNYYPSALEAAVDLLQFGPDQEAAPGEEKPSAVNEGLIAFINKNFLRRGYFRRFALRRYKRDIRSFYRRVVRIIFKNMNDESGEENDTMFSMVSQNFFIKKIKDVKRTTRRAVTANKRTAYFERAA